MRSLQLSLESGNSPEVMEKLSFPDAEIFIMPKFLSVTSADQHFDSLLTQTPWQQDTLNFGGKVVPIPRLQAWYGDKDSHYGYSGLALRPLPWTPLLQELKGSVEQCSNAEFNSVLLNYYRHGQDSVAWHSDDEKELGNEPVIASLSLGVTRRFEFKHRFRKGIKSCCELSHGSLIVMGKGVQQNWRHQVPKQPEIESGRINLTFRKIIAP